MPNPSELTRLEDELEFYKSKVKDVRLPKADKEYFLRKLREVERNLGVKSTDYNSGRF